MNPTAVILPEGIRVTDRHGFPPLLIIAEELSAAAVQGAREAYQDTIEHGVPLLVSGDNTKVFQLVDGRWQRLD